MMRPLQQNVTTKVSQTNLLKVPLKGADIMIEPKSLASVTMAPDANIQVLVEIVGATNLSPAALDGSRMLIFNDSLANSYCKIIFGADKIHKTKTIMGSNNPIWTVDHGSLFLLEATGKELSDNTYHLAIEVRNQDAILGQSSLIGVVYIDPLTLLESCTGDRYEFPICDRRHAQVKTDIPGMSVLNGIEGHGKGTLALRFRVPTDQDLDFLEKFRLCNPSSQRV